MSYLSRKRAERSFARLADGTGKGTPGNVAAAEYPEEAAITEYLAGGGPGLPGSPRAPELRAALVAKAQQAAADRRTNSAPVAAGRPRGWAPALARAAVAVLVALVVLAGIGAVSTNAMPGDPFYSVKRLIERAHLALLPGGQAEADALLNYADERMDELEYAGTGRLQKWYGPLASGAQSRIDSAYKDASGLQDESRARVQARIRRAEERLQALIGEAIPYASGEVKEDLERVMERARRRLGAPESEPGGPGSDGGGQTPGEPGGQQGTQQQQQQQQGQPPSDQSGSGETNQNQQQQQQQGPQPDSGQQGKQYYGTSVEQMLFLPQKSTGGTDSGRTVVPQENGGKASEGTSHYTGD
jgi:Domain of unknown function (DUF5667)